MNANPANDKRPLMLIVLIVVQSLCAVFFVGDVLADVINPPSYSIWDFSLIIEAIAAVSLVFAVGFEVWYLLDLLGRVAQMKRGLKVASGELQSLIDGYFQSWGLTSAESDVALFAIKGLSITEIAELRGSKIGTVKSHLNAIYHKANVKGRTQLISLLIEDLMFEPLSEPEHSTE